MNTKTPEVNCNSAGSAKKQRAPFAASTLKQAIAHEEQEFYRSKLAKPLLEVLRPDTDTRKAYEAQQEVLRAWIISQPAFQGLARKFVCPANESTTNSKESLK